jgi:gamma-glutamyl hydrolase
MLNLKLKSFVSIAVLSSLCSLSKALMERPVIGILTQPYWNATASPPPFHQYIAASYVKWLESGGAVAIPIPYDADEPLVREIFSQINGILFTGGSVSKLPNSARWIWDLALESNRKGEYFPVWGTCLGFEYLITLTGGEGTLEHGFRAENVSMPLIFPSEEDVVNSKGVFSLQSQLYPSDALRDVLSTHNITMNNHMNGISPENFLKNDELTSSFHITSTNMDLEGRRFISTIESILYPIFAVQYHPEKNNFEYGMQVNSTVPYEAISHTEEAVALSMHLAMFFVNKVRRSSIGEYTLGDRHPTVTTYPVTSSKDFEQIYIIPAAEHWVRDRRTPNDSVGLRGRASIS